MDEQTKILMDIKERLVRIETHLGDMNGKLVKHDSFLSKDCPNRHIGLVKQVTRITTIMSGITITAVAILNYVIIKYFGG